MSRSILAAVLAALSISAMLAQQQGPLTTNNQPSASVVVASVSIPANSWSMGASMPTARQGPFTGAIGSKIYVVGGITNTSVVNVNEIYDTATDSWSTGAPMPTPRWLAASAVVGNILYTIGGRSAGNVSLSVVEAYDQTTDTWSTKAPMPIANDNIYATVENNVIYVIGGFSQSTGQRLTTVLAYNPATNIWSTLAPLNLGKSLPAVALVGSTIIAAGGLANGGVTADNEGYNAVTNTWQSLAPSPAGTQASCFGEIGSALNIAGGQNTNSQITTTAQSYSLQTNSWTTLAPMPNAVISPGSAVVGGQLYCIGGSNNGGGFQGTVLNYVQIYQPPPSVPAISNLASAGGFGGFPSMAPGTWIEIFGSNLAADTRQWAASDFSGINAPTSLDGTKVSIGGQPAFIDYISPGQVNALVPSNVPTGLQQVNVTTAQGASPAYNVTVNAAEPGLLAPSSFNIGGIQYAVALFTDGAYVLPAGAIAGVASRPAKPGDVVTLYGIGFGPVTPTIPAGQVVQQLNSLTLSLQMSVGGVTAPLSYDGLAPGFAGLYLFNVTVPNLPAGTAALTFSLGGVPGTQALYLSIGN